MSERDPRVYLWKKLHHEPTRVSSAGFTRRLEEPFQSAVGKAGSQGREWWSNDLKYKHDLVKSKDREAATLLSGMRGRKAPWSAKLLGSKVTSL